MNDPNWGCGLEREQSHRQLVTQVDVGEHGRRGAHRGRIVKHRQDVHEHPGATEWAVETPIGVVLEAAVVLLEELLNPWVVESTAKAASRRRAAGITGGGGGVPSESSAFNRG